MKLLPSLSPSFAPSTCPCPANLEKAPLVWIPSDLDDENEVIAPPEGKTLGLLTCLPSEEGSSACKLAPHREGSSQSSCCCALVPHAQPGYTAGPLAA